MNFTRTWNIFKWLIFSRTKSRILLRFSPYFFTRNHPICLFIHTILSLYKKLYTCIFMLIPYLIYLHIINSISTSYISKKKKEKKQNLNLNKDKNKSNKQSFKSKKWKKMECRLNWRLVSLIARSTRVFIIEIRNESINCERFHCG